MKIAVLYNTAHEGGFAEADAKYAEDALLTVKRIVKALNTGGHKAWEVDIKLKDLDAILTDTKKRADVVFNLTEGVGLTLVLTVIKKLEEMDIPFAGASYYGHKLTSDKALVKKSMAANGIPTPRWKIYTGENISENWEYGFPAIVKSTTEHGSMSIHQNAVVKNQNEMTRQTEQLLVKYKGIPVIAEEFITGREINSTVIGSFDWAHMLPLSEVIFTGKYKEKGIWPIYTYEAKYNHGSADFKDAPSKLVDWLTRDETKMIEEMSLKICEATECFDYARMDLRFDTEKRIPYFIDLNSYPCLLDDPVGDTITVSRLAVGWNYLKILEEIAVSGIRRNKKEAGK